MATIYGLILTGGKSTRMQTDKAALKFHGKTQAQYANELLQPFCSKVFISCRRDQAEQEGHKGLEQIHDAAPYLDLGPLSGILSAMTKYPDVAWLVLACDLPFVTTDIIKNLIEHRNPNKMATAYISSYDQWPEPLCNIYEPQSFPALKKHLENGKTCPRKFLINTDVELLKQPNPNALDNINNPDEYQKALKDLKKK